tara:strand:+ start:4072 stop:4584 length:513 start_codon:yes stop_codon:yes gene_type:complete
MKTDRIYLRKIKESDLENVFKGLSHPDIIKYYGISFNSLEATKEQMSWFADLEKNNTGIWWAVCAVEDDEFLGAGGLNDLCNETKKAELGFWLLKDNWGKGIMIEAMPLIINYSFNKLGLKRLEALVETKNSNCIKALKKLNFNFEKTRIDCEVKNGKKISLDVYTKLNA